jgi:hypothetical protein
MNSCLIVWYVPTPCIMPTIDQNQQLPYEISHHIDSPISSVVTPVVTQCHLCYYQPSPNVVLLSAVSQFECRLTIATSHLPTPSHYQPLTNAVLQPDVSQCRFYHAASNEITLHSRVPTPCSTQLFFTHDTTCHQHRAYVQRPAMVPIPLAAPLEKEHPLHMHPDFLSRPPRCLVTLPTSK